MGTPSFKMVLFILMVGLFFYARLLLIGAMGLWAKGEGWMKPAFLSLVMFLASVAILLHLFRLLPRGRASKGRAEDGEHSSLHD